MFGHTHKPFERIFPDVAGWTNPIRVLNTGGWVVDTIEPVEVQGAAVVLVADNGAAVSLRLFTEPAGGGPATPVTVAEPVVEPGTGVAIPETPMLGSLAPQGRGRGRGRPTPLGRVHAWPSPPRSPSATTPFRRSSTTP